MKRIFAVFMIALMGHGLLFIALRTAFSTISGAVDWALIACVVLISWIFMRKERRAAQVLLAFLLTFALAISSLLIATHFFESGL